MEDMNNRQLIKLLRLTLINPQHKDIIMNQLTEGKLTKKDFVSYYHTLNTPTSKKLFNRLPKHLRKVRVNNHNRLKEVYKVEPHLLLLVDGLYVQLLKDTLNGDVRDMIKDVVKLSVLDEMVDIYTTETLVEGFTNDEKKEIWNLVLTNLTKMNKRDLQKIVSRGLDRSILLSLLGLGYFSRFGGKGINEGSKKMGGFDMEFNTETEDFEVEKKPHSKSNEKYKDDKYKKNLKQLFGMNQYEFDKHMEDEFTFDVIDTDEKQNKEEQNNK